MEAALARVQLSLSSEGFAGVDPNDTIRLFRAVMALMSSVAAVPQLVFVGEQAPASPTW